MFELFCFFRQESLGPHMPWLVCKAAKMAMHTLPNKEGLANICFPDDTAAAIRNKEDVAQDCYERAMETAPELIQEMESVLEKIARVYDENNPLPNFTYI